MSPLPDLKSEYADPKDYNRVLIRCHICGMNALHEQLPDGKFCVHCYGKLVIITGKAICPSPTVLEDTLEDAIRVWNAFALLTR